MNEHPLIETQVAANLTCPPDGLLELGWSEFFAAAFEPYAGTDRVPARVLRESRGIYHVAGQGGELTAQVSGHFRHNTFTKEDFPSVGDWVVVEAPPGAANGTIHAVLPRRSCFSRRVLTATEENIIAANVDTAFLVFALDGTRSFNLQKIERYLTLAWDSGASPVVVLNKADLCDDVPAHLDAAETVAPGAPVHAMSAAADEGVGQLSAYLGPGRTVVFLGPSGVGKSTLINRLLGVDGLATGDVRTADMRGRHTTTWRELVVLPTGGVLVDTPGMRDIQLWADEEAVQTAFADIEELSANCRFPDCRHDREPGCAVRAALEDGTLPPKRYDNYPKLQREVQRLARRRQEKQRITERAQRREVTERSRKRTKRRWKARMAEETEL
jgi:ribosome biogenesis GTPase